MNWQLFTVFLLFTMALILIPGPVVTLVIATSAAKGIRAGLVTVAGSATGLATSLVVIALGLAFVLNHALFWFEILRWAGIDLPGIKQVFYGLCLLGVVMFLPEGVWPPLSRWLGLRQEGARSSGEGSP